MMLKEEWFLFVNTKIMDNNRPPVGITPTFTYIEPRMLEIQRAMNRYMAEQLPVPGEWIEEYNRLVEIRKSK